MDRQQSDAANQLWRKHTDEETLAREAQQKSAGATHHPVEGPPPYGNQEVNLMAADIVARERERCARVVETWPVGVDGTAAELLRRIAAQLRRDMD